MEDLASLSGTEANGLRIEGRARLSEGDILLVGAFASSLDSRTEGSSSKRFGISMGNLPLVSS